MSASDSLRNDLSLLRRPRLLPAHGKRAAVPGWRVRRPLVSARHDVRRRCMQAARLAAAHYEVSVREIGVRGRGRRRVVRARHVAIYLARVVLGVSLAGAAAAFGRDRKTIAYACRAIEDARDDPAFDAALARLELAAGVLAKLEGAAA
jgi:hypothetical protein